VSADGARTVAAGTLNEILRFPRSWRSCQRSAGAAPHRGRTNQGRSMERTAAAECLCRSTDSLLEREQI